jgi:two-component system chemotaxis response regulator CheB
LRNDTNLAAVASVGKAGRTLARYSIVAIGASAGGLEAVSTVLRDLEADFASPIIVVLHLHPDYTSHMADILSRYTKLQVKNAEERDAIQPGVVYVATPDRHLLISAGQVVLSNTAAVNFSRPSIDTTFESIVKAYGSKVIGVVLSGSGKDGSEGLRAIKAAGGYTIVEDPLTARFSAMPRAAVSASSVDYVLPLNAIASLLVKLAAELQGTVG